MNKHTCSDRIKLDHTTYQQGLSGRVTRSWGTIDNTSWCDGSGCVQSPARRGLGTEFEGLSSAISSWEDQEWHWACLRSQGQVLHGSTSLRLVLVLGDLCCASQLHYDQRVLFDGCQEKIVFASSLTERTPSCAAIYFVSPLTATLETATVYAQC